MRRRSHLRSSSIEQVKAKDMKAENHFRRAALVIAGLDRHTADEVLDRLPEGHAAAIRHEIISVLNFDSDEQQAVIRDFLHPTKEPARSEIETTPRSSSTPQSSSLQDLLSLDNEVIASALMHERSSTVAALLASVPGTRAAMVLRLLPSAQQTRIILLLSHGIVTDEVVVNLIADLICDTHAQSHNSSPGMRHQDALQAILNALSPQERFEMLRRLEPENPVLAHRLADTD